MDEIEREIIAELAEVLAALVDNPDDEQARARAKQLIKMYYKQED